MSCAAALVVVAAAPSAFAAPSGAAVGAAQAAEPDNVVQVTRDNGALRYLRRAATTTPHRGTGATRSDFDGDGIDDVAARSAEGLAVSYSSAPYRDYLCSLDENMVCSVNGGPQVTGDFNGDGFDDLAIGNPDEIVTVGGSPAGAVWMLPGGPEGLDRSLVQHISENTGSLPGTATAYDRFGLSLAAGDVTGDGRDDLAIGIPGKTVAKHRDAGAVVVLKGSVGGISTAGARWLDQSMAQVPGKAEYGDFFGDGLAIGKVNRDKYADLVIGTPVEENGGAGHGSGMVTLMWGGASGVSLKGATAVSGDTATGTGWKKTGNYLWYIGWAVAIIDTNRDGLGEIITGSNAAQINNEVSGAVLSFPGRTSGLSVKGMKVLSLNTPGVAGTATDGDGFGGALAVGDVTGDGYGDLFVGVPGKAAGTKKQAGAVVLLRGSKSGLTGTKSQLQYQGGASAAEPNDGFGYQVALLNLNGTGGWDAVVSAPGEEVTGDRKGHGSGAITSYSGGSAGLARGTTATGQSIGLNSLPAGFSTIESYGFGIAGPQSGW